MRSLREKIAQSYMHLDSAWKNKLQEKELKDSKSIEGKLQMLKDRISQKEQESLSKQEYLSELEEIKQGIKSLLKSSEEKTKALSSKPVYSESHDIYLESLDQMSSSSDLDNQSQDTSNLASRLKGSLLAVGAGSALIGATSINGTGTAVGPSTAPGTTTSTGTAAGIAAGAQMANTPNAAVNTSAMESGPVRNTVEIPSPLQPMSSTSLDRVPGESEDSSDYLSSGQSSCSYRQERTMQGNLVNRGTEIYPKPAEDNIARVPSRAQKTQLSDLSTAKQQGAVEVVDRTASEPATPLTKRQMQLTQEQQGTSGAQKIAQTAGAVAIPATLGAALGHSYSSQEKQASTKLQSKQKPETQGKQAKTNMLSPEYNEDTSSESTNHSILSGIKERLNICSLLRRCTGAATSPTDSVVLDETESTITADLNKISKEHRKTRAQAKCARIERPDTNQLGASAQRNIAVNNGQRPQNNLANQRNAKANGVTTSKINKLTDAAETQKSLKPAAPRKLSLPQATQYATPFSVSVLGGKVAGEPITSPSAVSPIEDIAKDISNTSDPTIFSNSSNENIFTFSNQPSSIESKLEYIKKQGTLEDDERLYQMIAKTINKLKVKKDFESIKTSIQLDIARKYIKDFIDLRIALQSKHASTAGSPDKSFAETDSQARNISRDQKTKQPR
ncbi:hypothetical protein NEOKW01_1765 [Nematocida sp. AWRm80]|nr:hypothetical protein NEOKW01_1765 [Nematocida sp. AWRm80]